MSKEGVFARVPLHVSGFWAPVKGPDALHTGSLGAGLVLDLWVVARPTGSGCWVEVNGVRALEGHARRICGLEGFNLGVSASSPVGLGKGFALSSALSLSLSTLISAALGRGVSERSTWSAHVAEVEHSTGLGDVMAQFHGGLVVRTRPGPPGVGEAVVVRGLKPALVVAELPGSEPTPAVLSRLGPWARELVERAVERLLETRDPALFFELSRSFTRRLFDYSRVEDLLAGVRGVAGFYLKKSALVVWVEREWSHDLASLLKGRGLNTFETTVSEKGVGLVHSTEPPEAGEPADKGEAGRRL
ncbi:pantoate kinase [Thermogladius sp.]|uniref:pantoate kinase n=1 Tax=Thermogladius sp. TaxID=2023064 RepID=UPI003D10C1D7